MKLETEEGRDDSKQSDARPKRGLARALEGNPCRKSKVLLAQIYHYISRLTRGADVYSVQTVRDSTYLLLSVESKQPTRCYGLVVRISAFDSDGPGSNPGGTSTFFFPFLLFYFSLCSYF